MPNSVLTSVRSRSSLEAWCNTAFEIEEDLSGECDHHVYLFVADVVKSFDTTDRGIIGLVLGRLGLPGWFRWAQFEYHAHVRLRFKLSCGLGATCTRDAAIPQRCSEYGVHSRLMFAFV